MSSSIGGAGDTGAYPLAMDISDSSNPEFLQPTPDDGKKRKGKSKAKKAGGKKRKTRSGAIDVKARLYEYQRFKHSGPPITDFKDVPKGWQCQDLDLDESDIEGNIQRCHDRIGDGIMPQWWEGKLKRYTEWKENLDKFKASEKESLSWEVVVRLKNLEQIKSHLEEEGDEKYGQLPNVIALIQAYRSEKLVWTNGLVTYWLKGKRLVDKPVEFRWRDFCKHNKQGTEHVWVEGYNAPGPMPMFAFHSPSFSKEIPADCSWEEPSTVVEFDVRIPKLALEEEEAKTPARQSILDIAGGVGANPPAVFRFFDDTGSTFPTLFADDVGFLYDMSGQAAPFVCYMTIVTSMRVSYSVPSCIFEFTLHDDELLYDGKLTRPWVRQQCILKPGPCPNALFRLGGQWLRNYFYTATVPDGRKSLYVSESQVGLTKILPRYDVRNAKLPELSLPPQGQDGQTAYGLIKNKLTQKFMIDEKVAGPVIQ